MTVVVLLFLVCACTFFVLFERCFVISKAPPDDRFSLIGWFIGRVGSGYVTLFILSAITLILLSACSVLLFTALFLPSAVWESTFLDSLFSNKILSGLGISALAGIFAGILRLLLVARAQEPDGSSHTFARPIRLFAGLLAICVGSLILSSLPNASNLLSKIEALPTPVGELRFRADPVQPQASSNAVLGQSGPVSTGLQRIPFAEQLRQLRVFPLYLETENNWVDSGAKDHRHRKVARETIDLFIERIIPMVNCLDLIAQHDGDASVAQAVLREFGIPLRGINSPPLIAYTSFSDNKIIENYASITSGAYNALLRTVIEQMPVILNSAQIRRIPFTQPDPANSGRSKNTACGSVLEAFDPEEYGGQSGTEINALKYMPGKEETAFIARRPYTTLLLSIIFVVDDRELAADTLLANWLRDAEMSRSTPGYGSDKVLQNHILLVRDQLIARLLQKASSGRLAYTRTVLPIIMRQLSDLEEFANARQQTPFDVDKFYKARNCSATAALDPVKRRHVVQSSNYLSLLPRLDKAYEYELLGFQKISRRMYDYTSKCVGSPFAPSAEISEAVFSLANAYRDYAKLRIDMSIDGLSHEEAAKRAAILFRECRDRARRDRSTMEILDHLAPLQDRLKIAEKSRHQLCVEGLKDVTNIGS